MALQFYMSLKGQKQGQIKGNSTKSTRKGKWIELVSFDMDSHVPLDPGSGHHKGGRKSFPIVITKEVGAASPQLLDAHYQAEIFDEVVIEVTGAVSPGTADGSGRPSTRTGEVVVERITLTNATIANVRHYVGSERVSRRVLTDFGFVYGKVTKENFGTG
jgi:type VI secretion system secreted protein Hcp